MPQVRHSKRSLNRCVRPGAPVVVDFDRERRAVALVERRLDRVGQPRPRRPASTRRRSTITDSDVASRSSSAARAIASSIAIGAAADQQPAEPAPAERVERGDHRISASRRRRQQRVAVRRSDAVAVVLGRPRRASSPSTGVGQRAADDRIVEPDEQPRALRQRERAGRPPTRATRARPRVRTAGRSSGRRAPRAAAGSRGSRSSCRRSIADCGCCSSAGWRWPARCPSMRVDVRLLHPLEELAGVGRQRLDVAALAFGVDRVEGERGLPRPADAGEDDELPVRQREVDTLQVVGAGPPHDERAGRTRSAVPGWQFGHGRYCRASSATDQKSHVTTQDFGASSGRTARIGPLPLGRFVLSSPTSHVQVCDAP